MTIKKMSLFEIRAMKNEGKLHKSVEVAPEFNIPDEFWDNAKVVDKKNDDLAKIGGVL